MPPNAEYDAKCPPPPSPPTTPQPNRSARSPASPSPIIPRCLSPLMRSSFTILFPTRVSTCYHLAKAEDNKPRILPYVLALDPQCRLRGFRIDNKVVITVRTILVTCTPGLVSSHSLPRPPPGSLVHTSRPIHSCPYGNTFCISCTRRRLRRAAAARALLRRCGTRRSRTISGNTGSGSRLVRLERVCFSVGVSWVGCVKEGRHIPHG